MGVPKPKGPFAAAGLVGLLGCGVKMQGEEGVWSIIPAAAVFYFSFWPHTKSQGRTYRLGNGSAGAGRHARPRWPLACVAPWPWLM